MRYLSAGLAGLFLAILPIAASAHHSFAMFDQKKVVTLNGTVSDFQWTNPHAWIELAVPEKGGKVTTWSIELNSPNNLTRQGWKRHSLKPGDRVSVDINPLRDGKPGGLFLSVKLPDGKVLDSGLPRGKPVNVPQL
ncbi:MAG TPA: DUF6152 family protein [Sphingomonadaceae bacterium]|jgi:hypothetical protein|nr:DUF6152 family protein [Sphingomonadaceae bacterium]